MKVIARTEIGRVRPSNQDALLLSENPYGLYAVADGMGGHLGGDVASRLAVRMLKEQLVGKEPAEESFRQAYDQINFAIYERQLRDETLSGMGTTMTALWEGSDQLLLAHVGDSRAYWLHRGNLSQVTQDHSVVAELAREGCITWEEARVHPQKNLITRALGASRTVLTDVMVLPRLREDRFLLCSDGLTGYVLDAEIKDFLSLPAEQAADGLVSLAMERGGGDNITLVIAEVTL